MGTNIIGLSPDLIIHPGETLAEVLESRDMTQKELAQRCVVSEKHISNIINGENDISSSLAKKLEYALGIDAIFWSNLQTLYDQEMLDYTELHNITNEEISIISRLKSVIEFAQKKSYLPIIHSKEHTVIELRKLLGVNNLTEIPNMTYDAAYRAQLSVKIDPFVLFAWQALCVKMTEDIKIVDKLDTGKLEQEVASIKSLMFWPTKYIEEKLRETFASCGIAFAIAPYFKGAPVQGFIKKNRVTGKTILCMTKRRRRKDIFWFTLFHEIWHILKNDARVFIDFEHVTDESERRADMFSRNTLLSEHGYKAFLEANDFSKKAILKFASNEKVKPFIVVGRLCKEKHIPYSMHNSLLENFD